MVGSMWDDWDRVRSSAQPDPLEVLRAAAAYRRYFDAVEEEAIGVARKLGKTWEEIAAALGQSRQAVWQRARRDPGLHKALMDLASARWAAVKTDPTAWYRGTKPFGRQ